MHTNHHTGRKARQDHDANYNKPRMLAKEEHRTVRRATERRVAKGILDGRLDPDSVVLHDRHAAYSDIYHFD